MESRPASDDLAQAKAAILHGTFNYCAKIAIGVRVLKSNAQLGKRLPNCKILLMSGNAEATPLLEKANADGIHCDVLPKPIRPPELIAKLESLLA